NLDFSLAAPPLLATIHINAPDIGVLLYGNFCKAEQETATQDPLCSRCTANYSKQVSRLHDAVSSLVYQIMSWQFGFSSLLFPITARWWFFAHEPHPSMQRVFCVLLCVGLVCATLQNYTVDDMSPDIQYDVAAGAFKFVCNTSICIPQQTDNLYHYSGTLTNGSITFSFTGTTVYASLDVVGPCSVTVDGDEIARFNMTLADVINGVMPPSNFSKPDLVNGSHTLIVNPTTPKTLIGFEHLIYTAILPAKSHVGAIVGGVIGGVVLTIGALFVALLARRRKLILRRNQRKNAVLRSITSARANYKAGSAEHILKERGRSVGGVENYINSRKDKQREKMDTLGAPYPAKLHFEQNLAPRESISTEELVEFKFRAHVPSQARSEIIEARGWASMIFLVKELLENNHEAAESRRDRWKSRQESLPEGKDARLKPMSRERKKTTIPVIPQKKSSRGKNFQESKNLAQEKGARARAELERIKIDDGAEVFSSSLGPASSSSAGGIAKSGCFRRGLGIESRGTTEAYRGLCTGSTFSRLKVVPGALGTEALFPRGGCFWDQEGSGSDSKRLFELPDGPAFPGVWTKADLEALALPFPPPSSPSLSVICPRPVIRIPLSGDVATGVLMLAPISQI
ncbi:hypothetical protein C8R45DRAFT_1186259, partial [Mycena sanguinolenta]